MYLRCASYSPSLLPQAQPLESGVSEEKLRPRLMYAVPQTCRKLEQRREAAQKAQHFASQASGRKLAFTFSSSSCATCMQAGKESAHLSSGLRHMSRQSLRCPTWKLMQHMGPGATAFCVSKWTPYSARRGHFKKRRRPDRSFSYFFASSKRSSDCFISSSCSRTRKAGRQGVLPRCCWLWKAGLAFLRASQSSKALALASRCSCCTFILGRGDNSAASVFKPFGIMIESELEQMLSSHDPSLTRISVSPASVPSWCSPASSAKSS